MGSQKLLVDGKDISEEKFYSEASNFFFSFKQAKTIKTLKPFSIF